MTDEPTSSAGRPRPQSSASGPAHVPRRLSYASVASGATVPTLSALSRSGTLSQSVPPVASSHPPHYLQDPLLQRRSSAHDQEMASQAGTYSSATGFKKPTSLPNYSRKYARVPGFRNPEDNDFFVPSYLRRSKYMSKLEAVHRAKVVAQRQHRSSHSNSGTAASNPASSNIQRMAPSHRGMTYDIIESNPPKDEDHLMPLPSRWSDQDKYPGLDITHDGLDIKYSGSASKSEVEAASIRADHPMSPACGIYYYEIEIKNQSKDAAIAIGFASHKASLERLPGWEAESWAYHGDDGKIFFGESQGKSYGPTFQVGDIIGCGLNFGANQAFFTRNGQDLGVAFRELELYKPFPCVGVKKYSGAQIRVNFGQRPFVFDIDDKMYEERKQVQGDIAKAKTSSLQPPLDESALIQQLVAHFLAHDGYVETAKAFAEELRCAKDALNNVHHQPETAPPVKDDEEAIRRQEIRKATLDGDIDKALSATDSYFPSVLSRSPEIVFRMKCRKWIELLGKASDLRVPKPSSPKIAKLGHSNGQGFPNEDAFRQDMELDDQAPLSKGKEVVNGAANCDLLVSSSMIYDEIMGEVMEYGSLLQREYRDEKDEYKKQLDEMAILLAFDDPRDSPHGHLLDFNGRVTVAEELNSAILDSQGRSPSAAIDLVYRQTEAFIEELSQEGGPAAFVNLQDTFDDEERSLST